MAVPVQTVYPSFAAALSDFAPDRFNDVFALGPPSYYAAMWRLLFLCLTSFSAWEPVLDIVALFHTALLLEFVGATSYLILTRPGVGFSCSTNPDFAAAWAAMPEHLLYPKRKIRLNARTTLLYAMLALPATVRSWSCLVGSTFR